MKIEKQFANRGKIKITFSSDSGDILHTVVCRNHPLTISTVIADVQRKLNPPKLATMADLAEKARNNHEAKIKYLASHPLAKEEAFEAALYWCGKNEAYELMDEIQVATDGRSYAEALID